MAKLKGFSADQFVQTLALGFVFLWLITQVVDIGAIGKDACSFADGAAAPSCAEIETEQACVVGGCQWNSILIEPEGGYGSLVGEGFKWLIVAFAVIIAWRVSQFAGSQFNRKALVTLAIVGAALFFLYPIIQDLLPAGTLPDLAQTAYRLQSISPQGLQSAMGAP